MNNTGAPFRGRRLLVAEDDFFIIEGLLRELEQAGIQIIGPVPNLEQGLDLLARTDRLDGAILDINLQGELAFPLADALQARGIPFVFLSGYERAIVPARFRQVQHCEKLVQLGTLTQALFGQNQ